MSAETEQDEKRPIWQLSDEHKRLLFITFVGGLAANVGVVLIIGVGLVDARVYHQFQHSLGRLVVRELLPLGVGAIEFGVMFFLINLLQRHGLQVAIRRGLAWSLGTFIAVGILLVLLVVVGSAAGIK